MGLNNEIIGLRIKEFLVNYGNNSLDFKMIIKFDNGKVLYFNSLWLHYFDSSELEVRYLFEKIETAQERISEVYCFEGVGHYFKLESGVFISIHQEISYVEDSPLKYNYRLIHPHQTEDYDEMLNDIIELGDSEEIIFGPPKYW